jgi:hypothetical protein
MNYPKAKLAFVTHPTPGQFVLNLDDGKKFRRLEVSADQLSNIVADGARMIFATKSQPTETMR